MSYGLYFNNVYEYWTFLSSMEQCHLLINEAKELLKESEKYYIEPMKNKRGIYCSNYIVRDCDNKDVSPTNLFIVRDCDNPYSCKCGEEEFYCVYLPDGIKSANKDRSIICPAYEGIYSDIEYMMANYQIIPGVMIEINEENKPTQDYTILCPTCGREGYFEYGEVGLSIVWNE